MAKIKHVVSFSQYKLWAQCPHRWKLLYIDKLKVKEPSIHLLFGNAMHETLQAYLIAIYRKSVQYANSLDLHAMLKYRMIENFKQQKAQYKTDKPVTQEEMEEFYQDGIQIIDWFKTHRTEYFNSKKEELVGVELVLNKELLPGLHFRGYLDLVIKNKETGEIKIIDLKTSTNGWRSFQKNDDNLTGQLVLYKSFYSELYGVSPDKIKVLFLVLKRKLLENSPYPQKRIQKVMPASGKPTMNKIENRLNKFVETAFTDDGEYDLNTLFPKIPTRNNCRFCEFREREDLCDKKIGS